MQPKITNFIHQFKKTELARPCNFDVEITPSILALETITGASVPGKIFLAKLFREGRSFKTKIEEILLPGRRFDLIQQKTYGPAQHHPNQNAQMEPISMTIICSDDMNEKKFFDSWFEVISPMSEITPGLGFADEILEASNLGIDVGVGVRYDFAYKDDYCCEIDIHKYDLKGEKVYTVTLKEAFPFEMREIPLAWSLVNQYVKLYITFAYKYYTIKTY
jgi:hypothetical protein